VAQYRKALALDPNMAPARGNLASALCGCGREEEGIREFIKTLEIDPRNAIAHSGLAKVYYARGDFLQAARHCDRAMEQGCRFEPSMLEVLSRYRRPGEVSSGP
jgi:Flp pilus assembly protein TadD